MTQLDATVTNRRQTTSIAPDLSQPRVLLVDDQPARLLTYEAILSGVGVTCVRANSGHEALERLLHDSFAAILLDVSMPQMDGFETARLIREHPRFERTPIIFVTGVHLTQLDTLRGYEVGAIDYIPVPVVPEILRSKVALLVELYKRRSELESLNQELERARHERDDHYRAIFEHPSELTTVLEAERDRTGRIFDWRYRDANTNALKFLGSAREDVIGRRVSEIMPERAAHLIPLWARVVSERKPHSYESSAGESVHMLSLFPIGENTIVVSGVDITSRSKAEQAVQRQFDASRAEKEWLSAVLNSMNEEVYFTDSKQCYTCANPAALREFGHEAVQGISVGTLVSGLEVYRADGTPRPVEEAPPLRALAGEIIRDEQQIVRIPRTGELRHRQVSSAPVRAADGEIIGSVSVVRDVTEQMRNEQAIAADLRHTRLLRDVAARIVADDNLPSVYEEILIAAISIAGADAGTIQLLDPATQELRFAALHGFTPEMSSHFERVDASSQSPCGMALARGERVFMDFDPTVPDPDGSNRLHYDYGLRSAQSTPLISRTGQPLGMFSTHWRETHRIAERELRFLDLLARQAADLIERTRSEETLRNSAQLLRDADRRKDEFIAVLAHELRNPLVPIRTGVELLRNSRARPEIVDTVWPMMERQVGHMVRLIDDLLDVSRITSGKIELQRQRVTLASVVGTAIEANRDAINTRGLDLVVNLSDPHAVVDVDPTRFAQVISNLLQNATKFTPSGGRITLAAGLELQTTVSTPQLVVKVSDTGVGISSDMLPRVFDLFAQSDVRGRGSHSGLGIGLALARRLIELHGGVIRAHSDGEGAGSEFTLRVPAPRVENKGDDSGCPASRTLDGIRVMVIDDNRDAADVMGLLVAGMGGEAHVAYDGLSALDAFRDFHAAVVLLDLGMPGMDGYETCRRLRRQFGSGVGIVALTGWGQESDRQLTRQAGFDAHLTKPAEPSKLEEVIRSLASAR